MMPLDEAPHYKGIQKKKRREREDVRNNYINPIDYE
jgi:hypothetical protein